MADSVTTQLIDEVVLSLRSKGQTLGFAESCTGGLVSSLLTRKSGVSDVFVGSVVSYANEVKESILQVPSDSLEKFGAVSEVVAQQMAEGLRKCLKVDWAISVTGVAGPTGGTVEKPVGTVCFFLLGPNVAKSQIRQFLGDREKIQQQSAENVFKLLSEVLK